MTAVSAKQNQVRSICENGENERRTQAKPNQNQNNKREQHIHYCLSFSDRDHQQDVVIMHLDNLNQNSSDSFTITNEPNQSKSHHNFVHEIINSSDSESRYSLSQRPSASPSSSTRLSITDTNLVSMQPIETAGDACTIASSSSSRNYSGIRVKPLTNLFVGGSDQCLTTECDAVDAVATADDDDINSTDWNESTEQAKQMDDNQMYMSGDFVDDATDIGGVDFHAKQYLPSSLKFNGNSMSIYVKNSSRHRKMGVPETDTAYHTGDGNDGSNQDYENIICSPNFNPVSFIQQNADEVEADDDDESDTDGANLSSATVMQQAQTMRRLKHMLTDQDHHHHRAHDTTAIRGYANRRDQLSQMFAYDAIDQQFQDHTSQSLNGELDDPLLVPMHKQQISPKRHRKTYGIADELRNINFLKMYQAASAAATNVTKHGKASGARTLPSINPMRNAVVLRNPRGNQPRTYNTDALYAALMDVKSGESIYR